MSVQQPFAEAITKGHKDWENRIRAMIPLPGSELEALHADDTLCRYCVAYGDDALSCTFVGHIGKLTAQQRKMRVLAMERGVRRFAAEGPLHELHLCAALSLRDLHSWVESGPKDARKAIKGAANENTNGVTTKRQATREKNHSAAPTNKNNEKETSVKKKLAKKQKNSRNHTTKSKSNSNSNSGAGNNVHAQSKSTSRAPKGPAATATTNENANNSDSATVDDWGDFLLECWNKNVLRCYKIVYQMYVDSGTKRTNYAKKRPMVASTGDEADWMCCVCGKNETDYTGKRPWATIGGERIHTGCKNSVQNYKKHVKADTKLLTEFKQKYEA